MARTLTDKQQERQGEPKERAKRVGAQTDSRGNATIAWNTDTVPNGVPKEKEDRAAK